jgi:hypothetical protein
MITKPRQDTTWGELHVGSRGIFAAGFTEVSRPSIRRVVMRIEFPEGGHQESNARR